MSLVRRMIKRIKAANEILEKLAGVNIDGVTKLRNKIRQEISFLQKCIRNRKAKKEHLVCSNLTHLEAIANQLFLYETICYSVMSQKIMKTSSGAYKKICIDLVLCGGSIWMKVIARNRRALTLIARGEGSFGQKSIIDQALEFMQCSEQNVCYFKPPEVTFYFDNGIECSLAVDLTEIGINVEQRPPSPSSMTTTSISRLLSIANTPRAGDVNTLRDAIIITNLGIKKLNLGVTTMIAYVSALTNGGCNAHYESEILKKHAEWEKLRPVKDILDTLFDGKELYCCNTAANDFHGIVSILGGPGEKERARELMAKVKVVEDHPTRKLVAGGKIRERSLAIFGTGEFLQAITVTANQSFIRSAKNKGVTFDVFLHESRALTEGKEVP